MSRGIRLIDATQETTLYFSSTQTHKTQQNILHKEQGIEFCDILYPQG